MLCFRINEEYIDFEQNGYKIIIWCGIVKVKFIIICKKVDLVHTEGQGRNLKIIIITKSGFRNKRIQPVDINFFMKYPYVAQMYIKLSFKIQRKHISISSLIMVDLENIFY